MERYQTIHKKKIVVLENGVMPPSEEAIAKRQKLKAGDNFIILHIGSMNNDNKGQGGILEVFYSLVRGGALKNSRLILVGEGKLKISYQNFIDSHKLNNVFLTGQLSADKVTEQYLAADIFVLNSKNEGCPNVVLEAMSFGLPVISTKVGGISRVIEDNISGIIIDIGDQKRMAEKILLLYKNKKIRQELGDAARRRIEENFTLKSQVNKLIELID